MSHASKDGGVNKFMDHIKIAVNLRVEGDRHARSLLQTSQDRIVAGAKLREVSDKMIRDAEYMMYELISPHPSTIDHAGYPPDVVYSIQWRVSSFATSLTGFSPSSLWEKAWDE